MGSSDSPQRMMNACPNCGEVIDVGGCEPYSKVLCPSCSAPIRVRGEFLNFQIKKRIGEGGMSRVFRAVDQTLDRQVALKILNPDFAKDQKRTEQFEREAKITASISHPNVVKVYSAGSDQDHYFIAMELVPAGSLDERITERGALPEAEVLKVAAELVQGLNAAHEAGLIHRDMKPGNVLFSEDGTSKIVDFGLALDLQNADDDDGEIWATPYYVPPEKLYKEPEDFRSDIYSLGATLFHALAGKPPYSADTSSIEELKAIKDKPISLELSAPNVSMGTCELIDRMMARDPGARYESYDELLEHVGFASQQLAELGPAGKVGSARKMRKKVEERNALTAALVAFALVSVLLGGALWMHFSKVAKEREAELSGTDVGNGNGGGGVVISDGMSTTEKFEAGRQQLLSRKFDKAEKAFRQIATNQTTVETTANWARFNEGLAMLLQGNADTARGTFSKLAEQVGEAEPGTLGGFFQSAGEMLSSPLPVSPERMSEFDSTGGPAVGLLASGLKNWEHGAYTAAQLYFRAFRDAELERDSWVADFRKLMKPYLHDLDKLQHFPIVSRNSSHAAGVEALKKAREVESEVKQAGVKERLAKRVARLERLVGRLQIEERVAAAGRLAEIRGVETESLRNLLVGLSQFRSPMKLDAGVELLKTKKFEHPDIAERHADEIFIWSGAAKFIDSLIADLDRFGYTGPVELIGGTTSNRKIIAADREQLTYQVGAAAGRVTTAFSSITPASMLKISKALLPNFLDIEGDYIPRRENRVLFAYIAKEWAAAKAGAEEEMREEFREVWERLEQREADL